LFFTAVGRLGAQPRRSAAVGIPGIAFWAARPCSDPSRLPAAATGDSAENPGREPPHGPRGPPLSRAGRRAPAEPSGRARAGRRLGAFVVVHAGRTGSAPEQLRAPADPGTAQGKSTSTRGGTSEMARSRTAPRSGWRPRGRRNSRSTPEPAFRRRGESKRRGATSSRFFWCPRPAREDPPDGAAIRGGRPPRRRRSGGSAGRSRAPRRRCRPSGESAAGTPRGRNRDARRGACSLRLRRSPVGPSPRSRRRRPTRGKRALQEEDGRRGSRSAVWLGCELRWGRSLRLKVTVTVTLCDYDSDVGHCIGDDVDCVRKKPLARNDRGFGAKQKRNPQI
jgi:hypothetical protein